MGKRAIRLFNAMRSGKVRQTIRYGPGSNNPGGNFRNDIMKYLGCQ